MTKELSELIEQQTLDDACHSLWVERMPTTEAEKIVEAINALNRSIDKRLDKIVSALLVIARTLEHNR